MNNQQAMPIGVSDRSDILDILRGFALFGVLLDNVFGFTGWGFLTQPQREALSTWPADGIVGMLEQVFINGKFYSLFSLLFGIGFSIILIRNEKKGINPLKIFYRRLGFLLLLGLIHLLFFWEGDILSLYALIGFILPLFRKLSDKTLITLAVILVLSPLLFDLLSVIFHYKNGSFLEEIAYGIDKKTGVPSENYGEYLYKNGAGWQEWRNWQASGYLYRYSYILDSNRIPKVLGMFLIGFCIGRKMMYLHLEEHISLFKKLRFWGFMIGIPSAIACFYFEFFQKHIPSPTGLLHTLFYATSVVPLSLAYTSIVCLLWIKYGNKSKLRFLAPMGRMALTNYLAQTFLGIFIYYGVGLGLGGSIGPSLFVPIGIGVYLIQVLYSNLWFRYFNYGPFEWIWRMLTYGRVLKMIKK
ncbi:MAG TPA: DUF418 domain-containing protein [Chitinophagaceae bacterium]|nr:DUF418 domain-containing protein [Chitinophagaceae bacterium]